ncbi:MAG: sialate O-acetylesterase [Planctomycetaceae bacterium]|nr:sialate O-acetylesterase [Planctomycetaceae bacterium]
MIEHRVQNRRLSSSLWKLFSSLALLVWFLTPAAAEVPAQLPDPDDKPADQTKPVQVFILLGQSNMLGFGRIDPVDQNGTLSHLAKKEGKFPHLIDDDGNWTERQDVQNVHVMDKRGAGLTNFTHFRDMKNERLTVKKGHIGPELQFGHIMGHIHDEPVLLLKACIGNRSLGWDLLPPGSERFEFDGKVYAGYKDKAPSWVEGGEKNEVKWYAGRQYDADTAHAKEVLKNLEKYYPGYQGQGYEIAGFVFWQGHKDQNPAHASRYEQNLVHFIKNLRKDFNAPDAKFVLATIAFGGDELSGPGLTIAEAQLAVDGETGKYPEFKGNVKAIDARPFWRDKEVSPTGAGYHYNHNAETYMLVGDALGHAMAELLASER